MNLNINLIEFKNQIENNLIKKPFPIFVSNDFLNKEIIRKIKSDLNEILKTENITYQADKNTNPIESQNSYYAIGGGRSISRKKEFLNIFQSSKYWCQLIEFFSSKDFLKILTQPLNLDKKVKLRNSEYKKNIFQDLFYHNVYATFKISRYPSGSGMAYHRDFDDKFLSCMYYLGFSDNVERNFGGTQFFYETNKINKLNNNFFDNFNNEKNIIDHYSNDRRNFKLFKDVKPNLNTFVYFLRTDNSWHKVNSFQLPENITRDNLQINFMHCKYDLISTKLLKIKKYLIMFLETIYQEFLSLKFYFKEKTIDRFFYEIKNDNKLFSYRKKDLSLTKFSIRKIKNFLHFVIKSTILFKSRRRKIRELILKICEPLNENIFIVANYALNYEKIPQNPKILSFGVLDDLRFEEKISNDFDTIVFTADPTPDTAQFIKNKNNPNIVFSPKALSKVNGDIKFYLNSKITDNQYRDGSIKQMSKDQEYIRVKSQNLKNFMNEWGCKFCDILKMDIEGCEIDILSEIISYPEEEMPTQIVCEIDIGDNFYEKKWEIYGILIDLKKYYNIYYIPRLKRFSHLDLLLIKK